MTREEKIAHLSSVARAASVNAERNVAEAEALEAAGMDAGLERRLGARHELQAQAYLDHAMRLAVQMEEEQ